MHTQKPHLQEQNCTYISSYYNEHNNVDYADIHLCITYSTYYNIQVRHSMNLFCNIIIYIQPYYNILRQRYTYNSST